MAVRPLRLFPDPILAKPCADVSDVSRIRTIIQDLWDTLASTPGVGLAAPQIGYMERISVIDVGRSKRKPAHPSLGKIVLINPRILEGRGEQIPREGCLSVPDLLANVRRFEEVTVRSTDAEGREQTIRSKGFEALALQHEIDHLDGKLFLDRVANIRTDLFRRKNVI